jgi:hypothetical protein
MEIHIMNKSRKLPIEDRIKLVNFAKINNAKLSPIMRNISGCETMRNASTPVSNWHFDAVFNIKKV